MPARLRSVALGLAAVLGLAALAAADDPKDPDSKAAPTADADSKAKADPDAEPADKPADATPGDEDKTRGAEDVGKASSRAKSKSKGKEGDEPETERATFGGGCFWCMEAVFERIEGVTNVVSGYAGGTHKKPTYPLVSSGLTGHAEVIQVEYDPKVITYEQLLQVFWMAHDPTTLNRQGPDEGTQYRSIILYHNEDQRKAAIQSYQDLTAARAFNAPIVTQLVPLKRFYPAEKHHQNYFRRYASDPYCQAEIVPKLQKLGLLKH
jgi:peptide-methionine (S)-S-oxide reductase